ncbi:DUF1285 domain-containing protein [Kordiimonas marina]|uniref:DUF1285 domain-containing protein n=1 Tax=Kordiimonas marina TaxID=2872312 RepID=UPI001FF10459|nr:DUF1285 domain-containing protein [Kordiimonas marina]MCJ9427529.1 DUF1285 domain-containing protein [Kordiimonas marina]
MTADRAPTSFNLEALIKQVEGQRFPPVEKWNPDFCGDIDMEIKRDGTWFYMGTPIGRKRMVKLFSTVLRHDADGRFYLVTPVEKVGIRVEDAPFIATQVDILKDDSGAQLLKFTTNVGDEVIADAEHPIRVETDAETAEPRPYVLVRGRLEALIARPVFYELVEAADMQGKAGVNELTIESRGERFSLGQWQEG